MGSFNDLFSTLIGAGNVGVVTGGGCSPGSIIPYQPPQMPQPVSTHPSRLPALSDYDIELMALCIANKHPVVEGHAGCFCALKRLEKGITKE